MDPRPYSRARWQLIPDIPGDPEPNSRRTLGKNQEWFDQYNYVRRDPSTRGCQDAGTQMETFRQPMTAFIYGRRLFPPALAPRRSTVTVSRCQRNWIRHSNHACMQVCDEIFDSRIYRDPKFALLNPGNVRFQLPPLTDEAFGQIASAIMLHEIYHAVAIDLVDFKTPGGLPGMGWAAIMQMHPLVRLRSAENFMFLAILAQLEEWQIKLDPDPNLATQGYLVRDDTLRALPFVDIPSSQWQWEIRGNQSGF